MLFEVLTLENMSKLAANLLKESFLKENVKEAPIKRVSDDGRPAFDFRLKECSATIRFTLGIDIIDLRITGQIYVKADDEETFETYWKGINIEKFREPWLFFNEQLRVAEQGEKRRKSLHACNILDSFLDDKFPF